MLEVHVPQGVEVQLLSDPPHGRIAQLVERFFDVEKVSGSNPDAPTRYWSISSMVERFVYIEDVGGSSPSSTTEPKLPMWSRRPPEERIIGVRFTASALVCTELVEVRE